MYDVCKRALKLVCYKVIFRVAEIHCVNETADVLGRLIHHIGLEMRSNACVQHCRRIRWGHFRLEHAITSPEHCSLEDFLKNMVLCRNILKEGGVATDGNVAEMEPLSEALQGPKWLTHPTRDLLEEISPQTSAMKSRYAQRDGDIDLKEPRVIWQAEDLKCDDTHILETQAPNKSEQPISAAHSHTTQKTASRNVIEPTDVQRDSVLYQAHSRRLNFLSSQAKPSDNENIQLVRSRLSEDDDDMSDDENEADDDNTRPIYERQSRTSEGIPVLNSNNNR